MTRRKTGLVVDLVDSIAEELIDVARPGVILTCKWPFTCMVIVPEKPDSRANIWGPTSHRFKSGEKFLVVEATGPEMSGDADLAIFTAIKVEVAKFMLLCADGTRLILPIREYKDGIRRRITSVEEKTAYDDTQLIQDIEFLVKI